MKILTYPVDSKQLRLVGAPVTQEMVKTTEFTQKLEEMKVIAKQDGVGLAATQVGWLVQLFLILVDRDLNPIEPEVILNPKIESYSPATEKLKEGCLSFPGLPLGIERPLGIGWSYETLAGEKITTSVEGYYARILQHEVDHLNGKLFIDKATAAQRLAFERWLKRRLT